MTVLLKGRCVCMNCLMNILAMLLSSSAMLLSVT